MDYYFDLNKFYYYINKSFDKIRNLKNEYRLNQAFSFNIIILSRFKTILYIVILLRQWESRNTINTDTTNVIYS